MQSDNLLQNILDVIEEGQLKLGYRSETLRLFYPLTSLCAFVGEKLNAQDMESALEVFAKAQRDTLGEVQISRQGDRFCLAIPPQGLDYVHEQINPNGFLAGLIRLMGTHGTSFEQLLSHFRAYSACVHVETLHNGEFDYLVYFEDGCPDAYRYCIADEGCHLTYHRFTQADYAAFGF